MLLSRALWKSWIGKRAAVKVLEQVRFDILTPELCALMELAFQWQRDKGETLTITGADRAIYPEGGVHQAGYAWDIRVFDIRHPAQLASFLLVELKKLDANYKVLYGSAGHTDHIHVAWEGSSRFIYPS